MRHSIVLDAAAVVRAFQSALQRPPGVRGDFYEEIRRSFKEEFCLRIEAADLAVKRKVTLASPNLKTARVVPVGTLKRSNTWQSDVAYCAGFGHYSYSLTSLNESRLHAAVPSLRSFHDSDTFNIGNIAVCVENIDAEIDITVDSSIELTGYAYDMSPRKRKSYVMLLGVQIRREALEGIFDAYLRQCSCEPDDLDEIRIGIGGYPVVLVCRRCGNLHTCACFKSHFSVGADILRFLGLGTPSPGKVEDPLETAIRSMRVKDSICALCSDRQPRALYGHTNRFLRSHGPYCLHYDRLHPEGLQNSPVSPQTGISRDAENAMRARFGYPLVGQGWVTETLLFKIVERMFSPLEVVHHYRGPELERLEVDIWIPELKLAIEYQGEQHFAEVAHWGGADGLARRRENDQRKRALCKQLGYHLVEFFHTEELTEGRCLDKLAPYVPAAVVA